MHSVRKGDVTYASGSLYNIHVFIKTTLTDTSCQSEQSNVTNRHYSQRINKSVTLMKEISFFTITLFSNWFFFEKKRRKKKLKN